MKHTKHHLASVVLVFTGAASSCLGALNWEGSSGVFMNPIAYPIAQKKVETAVHYIDLDNLGSIETFSVTGGIAPNVDLGFTRLTTDANGVRDQNILHAKWQFVKETPQAPAVAAWVLYRDTVGGKSSADIGLTATKVIPIGKNPLILEGGVRSTKAIGNGLFGFSSNRKLQLDAAIAYFVTKNVIIGTEYREQPDSRNWTDVAVRYQATKDLNIDLGIANFAPGINNQVALGVTYAF